MEFCYIAFLFFLGGYVAGSRSYVLYLNFCNRAQEFEEMQPINVEPIKIEKMER